MLHRLFRLAKIIHSLTEREYYIYLSLLCLLVNIKFKLLKIQIQFKSFEKGCQKSFWYAKYLSIQNILRKGF